MKNGQPKTRAEAESQRYGAWAGHPRGNAFNPRYCAAHIQTGGRGSLPTQCGAKPGNGPDGLYCKAHAREFFPRHDGNKAETWWYTQTMFGWKIEPRRVSHSTDAFIWLLDSSGESRKAARKDQYGIYWPTKEEAVQYQLKRAKSKRSAAEAEIREMDRIIKKLS